jgi:hypothetical protein
LITVSKNRKNKNLKAIFVTLLLSTSLAFAQKATDDFSGSWK